MVISRSAMPMTTQKPPAKKKKPKMGKIAKYSGGGRVSKKGKC